MTPLHYGLALAVIQTVASVAKRRQLEPVEALVPWGLVFFLACLTIGRLGIWTHHFSTLGIAIGGTSQALWLACYVRQDAPSMPMPAAATIGAIAAVPLALSVGAVVFLLSPTDILLSVTLWRRVVLGMVISPLVMAMIGATYPLFAGWIGSRFQRWLALSDAPA